MACIRKRRGRWVLDFYDQDGKRRWETHEAQKAAKDALSDRLKDVKKGTYCPPREIPTLRNVAEAWLANKADRRPATVAYWENHVHRHILPALGDRRVDRISTTDVEAFRDSLRSTAKMLPITANRVLTTLTAIFDRAVRDRVSSTTAACCRRRAGAVSMMKRGLRRTAAAGITTPSPKSASRKMHGCGLHVLPLFSRCWRGNGAALVGGLSE